MKEIEVIKAKENYTIGNLGDLKDLKDYEYQHNILDVLIPGKVFISEKLNTTSVEVSFQVLGPNKEIPFDHMHNENEEVYIVLKGKGQFIIDNETTDVKEGTIVRIAPAAKRRWLNNSNEDLIVIVIQGAEGSLNKFTVTNGKM